MGAPLLERKVQEADTKTALESFARLFARRLIRAGHTGLWHRLLGGTRHRPLVRYARTTDDQHRLSL
jgi:hypothetical protein